MKQIMQWVAVVLLGAMSAPGMATELTGNAGFVTDYVWRGIDASNGKAAAQGGLDASWDNGLFAGTWLSTVEVSNGSNFLEDDSGIEIDLYGGWGGETGDWSYSVSGTYYTFTDNVAEDFIELNLSGGWKWFTLTLSPGEYDSQPESQKYLYGSLTGELKGFYATLGYWDWDDDDVPGNLQSGGYGELGYSNTLEINGTELFDYTISYVYAEDDLIVNDQSQNTLIFGVTKHFGILD
ncbi:MAG: TorF family putative porin [Gammaproteobacteria bacterium]